MHVDRPHAAPAHAAFAALRSRARLTRTRRAAARRGHARALVRSVQHLAARKYDRRHTATVAHVRLHTVHRPLLLKVLTALRAHTGQLQWASSLTEIEIFSII